MSPADGPSLPEMGRDDPVAFLLKERGLVRGSARGNGQRRHDEAASRMIPRTGRSDHRTQQSAPATVPAPARTPEKHGETWADRADSARSMPKSRRNTASRQRVMALTMMDQAASSASNFALAFLVAHYSDAQELGIFAIAQTTYVVAQGLVRSLTSDCMLTRSDTDDRVMARYEHAGFGSAMLCASLAAIVMLVLSAFCSAGLQTVTLILALSFPLLAAQDYARYIGITRYNPSYSVWLDAVWTVLFLAVYEILRHQHDISLPWVFGAWSATGAAVGLFALWNHLRLQGFRGEVRFWFRSERTVGLRFAAQWLLVSSWQYLAIYLFIVIFSVAVIGQFKLAQVAISPVTVLTQGLWTALVALAARYFKIDVGKAIRFVLLAAAGAAVVMLVWGVVIYAAPVHTMTKLLGPTWPAARRLVPLMAVSFALAGASACVASGLRALRAAKENLYISMAMVPVLAGSSLIGGIVWGVQAALAGLCVGYGVYAVVTTVVLFRCARRITPDSVFAGEDATDPVIPIEADNQNSVLPATVVYETAEPV